MSDYGKHRIQRAINLALELHQEQKYGNLPYITHLFAVANRLDDKEDIVVAFLHDIVEDTNTHYHEIEWLFDSNVADCVRILTRKDDESYGSYIRRIAESRNERAIRVKIADLKANLHAGIYINDVNNTLVKRYDRALSYLDSVYKSMLADDVRKASERYVYDLNDEKYSH